jgi:hypothetical protein
MVTEQIPVHYNVMFNKNYICAINMLANIFDKMSS